ncbi:MAG: M23 family metallopeptidase, partial [Deltaproteobacteria bacterium]|nr:M23 family metallopeptidase [Deltaproteobacteria bacterium]
MFEPALVYSAGLQWPIDCIPGSTCTGIGLPDSNSDGRAYNCGSPGYLGHDGTDMAVSWSQMDEGVDVYAAAAGEVLWVFDGKYDRCPDASEPDCSAAGYLVCTELGPYCGTGFGSCFLCFAGGNVIVIRHENVAGVFATRYDHLRNGSILVTAGAVVTKGQKIAEVGSAGRSSGPHLHFEVWGTGFYEVADPWAGSCGPNYTTSLWDDDPLLLQEIALYAADLNNDGRDDLIYTDIQGQVYYMTDLSSWTRIGSNRVVTLTKGDFDSDGNEDDLAGVNKNGYVI